MYFKDVIQYDCCQVGPVFLTIKISQIYFIYLSVHVRLIEVSAEGVRS